MGKLFWLRPFLVVSWGEHHQKLNFLHPTSSKCKMCMPKVSNITSQFFTTFSPEHHNFVDPLLKASHRRATTCLQWSVTVLIRIQDGNLSFQNYLDYVMRNSASKPKQSYKMDLDLGGYFERENPNLIREEIRYHQILPLIKSSARYLGNTKIYI